MELEKIQRLLREKGLDGWLFYDFHNRDEIAYRILGLDFGKFTSRRWFYFVPAEGQPRKLVSKVESKKLDPLPGEKILYLSWKELREGLKKLMGNAKRIAMQYSKENNIPYVSKVDAGTVELLRNLGYEIESSADLITYLEAVIDERGYKLHREAADLLTEIVQNAFNLIGERKGNITEYEVQQFIMKRFEEEGLETADPPIVAVNEHAADPHYEPKKENSAVIKEGDRVLIDLWAKRKEEGAIYADITWCAFVGENPPEDYQKIFQIVTQARDRGVEFLKERIAKGEKVFGYEVDDAVREVIDKAGYGQYFIHRTGHNIGQEVHGNGPHIDHLETIDERQLVPGLVFSIEPGIYIPGGIGVRSEINVCINLKGEVEVTTQPQKELFLIR